MSAVMSAPAIRDLTAEDVFAKAVCMTLSLHKIGLQRKGPRLKSTNTTEENQCDDSSEPSNE
jgi:hypothetical protein